MSLAITFVPLVLFVSETVVAHNYHDPNFGAINELPLRVATPVAHPNRPMLYLFREVFGRNCNDNRWDSIGVLTPVQYILRREDPTEFGVIARYVFKVTF